MPPDLYIEVNGWPDADIAHQELQDEINGVMLNGGLRARDQMQAITPEGETGELGDSWEFDPPKHAGDFTEMTVKNTADYSGYVTPKGDALSLEEQCEEIADEVADTMAVRFEQMIIPEWGD